MNNPLQKKSVGTLEREIRHEGKQKKTAPTYVLNNDIKAFLNLLHPPALFNVAETAARFGLKPHDIPILVARGFLKPVGNPMPNCEKYFARVRICELEEDEAWLSRASDALRQHWRVKNARKGKPVNGHAAPIVQSTIQHNSLTTR